jgi:mediator of RNA polymerase II transcription subunit 14
VEEGTVEGVPKVEERTVEGVPKVEERQEGDPSPMPGAIMDQGERSGLHTNHDRAVRPNGVNGGSLGSEKMPEKGKGHEPQQKITPLSATVSDAPNGMGIGSLHEHGPAPSEVQDSMNRLPPEIVHITQGYVPLAKVISRLAQKTHHDVTAMIMDLARMQVPASAANGNASHTSSIDDNSAENINKKGRLLNFVQNTHSDWTKALVITSWSRNSEDVSKLIDLKVHLDQQKSLYDEALQTMSEVKRSLPYARVPNPDLRTAIQILSTGKSRWMPEVCLRKDSCLMRC